VRLHQPVREQVQAQVDVGCVRGRVVEGGGDDDDLGAHLAQVVGACPVRQSGRHGCLGAQHRLREVDVEHATGAVVRRQTDTRAGTAACCLVHADTVAG